MTLSGGLMACLRREVRAEVCKLRKEMPKAPSALPSSVLRLAIMQQGGDIVLVCLG